MIIGIDPGVLGAFAAINGTPTYLQMPIIDNSIDPKAIEHWLKGDSPSLFVIEHQEAFGRGSKFSFFRQGFYYGQLIGWLQTRKNPFMAVTPQHWRKAVLGGAKGKEASITYVTAKYPNLALPRDKRKCSGVCDAICLAEYGRRI